jgi:Ca-activated chloride channel homolog
MPQRSRVRGLVLSFCLAGTYAHAQAPYSLRVSVDEVDLTFHAEDAHGLPVNDLKLDELKLLDNGKPPSRVVVFRPLLDFPIRAGILLDTSVSVAEYLARNRAIAAEYTNRLMRQQADQAFVMNFDFESRVAQPWTNDKTSLDAGLRSARSDTWNRMSGTAIIDSIYRACLNQFGKLNGASANFILLFSDGEDNASHAYLSDAVEMCQRTNTAIYAFRVPSGTRSSDGPRTLAQLASQTGGQVFDADDSDAAIYEDLRTIEADLRNQYRLIYKPADLKPNGAFHRIALWGPKRVQSIVVRSGYYAPVH